MGARFIVGLASPSSPRPKPICGQLLPRSPNVFGRPGLSKRSALPHFGKVHDSPVNEDGAAISIVGALIPGCVFPLEFDDGALGVAPRKIAIASSSRPSRVRRVTSSMLTFNRAFMGAPVQFRQREGIVPPHGGIGGDSSPCLAADERSQRMRSLSAAFTSGLACKAPST